MKYLFSDGIIVISSYGMDFKSLLSLSAENETSSKSMGALTPIVEVTIFPEIASSDLRFILLFLILRETMIDSLFSEEEDIAKSVNFNKSLLFKSKPFAPSGITKNFCISKNFISDFIK